jgi:hypothetical protein
MKTYGMLWSSKNTHKSVLNRDVGDDDIDEDGEEDRGEDRHGDGWGERESEGEEGVTLSRVASSALKELVRQGCPSNQLKYAEKELKKPLNSFAEVI